ncbi:MAG: protein kinase [Vicinamibacterales bacterium]
MATERERLADALAGRYRVERELGRGGMAVVYLARDLRHDRAVAIKALRPDLTAALGTERFAREIGITARLDHPHIVPLLDSGEADGLLYYVMPFVDGESLRGRLYRERQLPLGDALAITRALADGLHYAHELGVIHRDVKPENVLLGGGHARLADFGIARMHAAADASTTAALTGTGVAIGTIAYMSPEQATGDRELDRRSDIYSLAAVTYEMLAGQPPHSGATPETVMLKKLREPVSSLIVVRETVPVRVDEAIRRALARVPADRFATAAAFIEAIEPGRLPDDTSVHRVSSGSHGGAPVAGAPSPTVVPARRSRSPAVSVLAGLAAVVIAAGVSWYSTRGVDAGWLNAEALPSIERHLNVADFESAYAVVRQIQTRMPESPELAELWNRLSWRVTIPSDPPGAKVFRRGYNSTEGPWEELGVTPLENVRIPFGLSRLRFELDGYQPLERAIGGAHLNWEELSRADLDGLLVGPDAYRLEPDGGAAPPEKVRVSGWSLAAGGETVRTEDFLIGRHEVTNAQYKTFVDANGYGRPELWEPPVMKGRTLSWDEAKALFVDRTGRPGPATWVAGDYPEGEGAFPVSGVSWYEAAAYARFKGEELPTARHWQRALAVAMFPWLLPISNFGGQGARAVTDSRAMTHVGAYDMTGNVREWTATRIGDERVILGGSWNDPYYIADARETAAPPWDRSTGNGFRLAVTRDEPAVAARLREPIQRTAVPSALEQAPVSDAVYAAYGRVFDYQHGPLNASVDGVSRTRIWTRERIHFDAGYGNERVVLHLYLPTSGSAPYPTVVYWPGWDTFGLDDVDLYFGRQLDFLVKSGRAVAFPIYKGIFERSLGNSRLRPPFNTAEYRDNAIDGVKDLRRTIDYLETRSDIDARTLTYFGYSWGGVNGPLALAHEPRLRTAIIDIGMLPGMANTPEVDPVNALPRVRQPTLMLSGEFDALIPMDNANRYFALLGAPASDKRHVVALGGHFIPRDLLIRESLDWLDKYSRRTGG